MPRNGNVAHKLQEAGSQAAQKQQQLSTDAPVAQNSNRLELLGLSMEKQGGREEGKGLGGSTHSQPVVLPLILLTRSSFYATQPVAQVAPVPHYPPLSLSLSLPYSPCPAPRSVQTAISLPQRALWLVIWRLISGLT